VRVLSVDGGGYLGLATAAFIRGIEHHFGLSFHEKFDLFCGTSTGAIIALALATGMSGAEVVELYKSFGPSVFPYQTRFRRYLNRTKGFLLARYDNAPLTTILQDRFGDMTLGDLYARSKMALITAFNVTTGTPRIFKTDHSQNLSRDGDLKLRDIALASSAAPIFLPLVRVTNPREDITETFCDGGVVANHPALLGYVEALTELAIPPDRLRLLSISTPRTDLGEGVASTRSLRRGLVGWRKSFPSMFIDSNSIISHEILRRLVKLHISPGPRYLRVDMPNQHSLPMDLVTKRTTEILEHIGATLASSNDMRAKIEEILS
jgi:patatin-like phospholipase/acyl hydrolase